MAGKLGIALSAVGLVGVFANTCLYDVPAGHRALIFQRFGKNKGVSKEVIGEGTHIYVPYFQHPIILDTRITPRQIRSETGSKDLQTIQVALRVLFRPEPAKLHEIYTNLGYNYDEQIFTSIGTETLKTVIAMFNAEELVTQRESVSAQIRASLMKRAAEYGIILEDVSITHLAFSKEFTQAIETKQVAQQMAERQRFLVEKSRHETEAEIILAEGETEAANMIAQAMRSGTGFLELRKLEAAKEIAGTLASSKNITYLPSNGNMLFNLNQPSAARRNSSIPLNNNNNGPLLILSLVFSMNFPIPSQLGTFSGFDRNSGHVLAKILGTPW